MRQQSFATAPVNKDKALGIKVMVSEARLLIQAWRSAAIEPTFEEEDRIDKEAFRRGWLQGYRAAHNQPLPWN
jgi:hypothetical protein